MTEMCPTCGKQVNGLEREIRLKLPQPIVDVLRDEPNSKRVTIAPGGDFARLDDVNFFVRVLLPVQLDIAYEFRFGVWMSIDEAVAKNLWKIWEKPEYETVSFSGHLASLVPPWNDSLENKDCSAEVRDKKSLPFIVASKDEVLSKVLETPWPVHECESIIRQVWG